MGLSWIDEYVDGVIDHCYSEDIYEIYHTLKIGIIKTCKEDLVLQGNEALYIRNYLGAEVVFIRDDLPYKYEQFVLSHELGHAILHTEIASAAYNNKLIVKGKLENQADYFAIKLLDINLDDVYYKGFTNEQIAKDLCVAEESLIYINEVIS